MFLLSVGQVGGAGQTKPPDRAGSVKLEAKAVQEKGEQFTSATTSSEKIESLTADIVKIQETIIQAAIGDNPEVVKEQLQRDLAKLQAKRLQELTAQGITLKPGQVIFPDQATTYLDKALDAFGQLQELGSKLPLLKDGSPEKMTIQKEMAKLNLVIGLYKEFITSTKMPATPAVKQTPPASGAQKAEKKSPEPISIVIERIVKLTAKAIEGKATAEDLRQLEKDKEALKATLSLMKALGLQAGGKEDPEPTSTIVDRIAKLIAKAIEGKATPKDLEQLEKDKEALKAILSLIKDMNDLSKAIGK